MRFPLVFSLPFPSYLSLPALTSDRPNYDIYWPCQNKNMSYTVTVDIKWGKGIMCKPSTQCFPRGNSQWASVCYPPPSGRLTPRELILVPFACSSHPGSKFNYHASVEIQDLCPLSWHRRALAPLFDQLRTRARTTDTFSEGKQWSTLTNLLFILFLHTLLSNGINSSLWHQSQGLGPSSMLSSVIHHIKSEDKYRC